MRSAVDQPEALSAVEQDHTWDREERAGDHHHLRTWNYSMPLDRTIHGPVLFRVEKSFFKDPLRVSWIVTGTWDSKTGSSGVL